MWEILMSSSLWKNIDTLSAYTEDDSVKEMLKGKWYKYQSGFIRVTILKDLAIITSGIASEALVLDIELPEHEAFFLHVDSATASTVVEVAANAALSLNVGIGQQVWAFFNYS